MSHSRSCDGPLSSIPQQQHNAWVSSNTGNEAAFCVLIIASYWPASTLIEYGSSRRSAFMLLQSRE